MVIIMSSSIVYKIIVGYVIPPHMLMHVSGCLVVDDLLVTLLIDLLMAVVCWLLSR